MLDTQNTPKLTLRPPETVLCLARMGQMMPTRLSFLRVLVRRLCAERAVVRRIHWDICDQGYGQAAYAIDLGGHSYSLVAISNDLPPEQRSDRVIATAWDAAFVLFDGIATADDIARIATQAPKQEAGRFSPRDLVLSRANKSVRMWNATVAALHDGRQPDPQMIRDIGYLMRTTAVYGNGKFGIADRHLIAERPGLDGPFAAEMLTVYLIRHFTLDLVQHVSGAALDPALARHLGIGNATGLGMAPFLVNHPVLLHNWTQARETALARVCARDMITDTQKERLNTLALRAQKHLADWHVPADEHDAILRRLETGWAAFRPMIKAAGSFDALWQLAQDQTDTLQELLIALLIETCPEDVDDLARDMCDRHGPLIAPFADTDAVKAAIEDGWVWALNCDFDNADDCRRFWYVSEAKLEPRLGDRFAEPGAELETPLDIARRVAQLHADLPEAPQPVSAFTETHPRHAHAINRVALMARYPYAEIRDNLIAATCRPIDMLRCKLSFFGATKFDPKSDLWTRITLAQGAPLGNELRPEMDDWWLPVMEQ